MTNNFKKMLVGLLLCLTLMSTAVAVDWETKLTEDRCGKQDFKSASGKN